MCKNSTSSVTFKKPNDSMASSCLPIIFITSHSTSCFVNLIGISFSFLTQPNVVRFECSSPALSHANVSALDPWGLHLEQSPLPAPTLHLCLQYGCERTSPRPQEFGKLASTSRLHSDCRSR